MGWFWQSSSPKPEGSRDSASPAATTPPPPAPTAPTQTPPAEAESNSTDREMAIFMNMLLKDTQSSTSQSKTQQQPPPPATPSNPSSSSWLPWSSTKPDHPPTTEQQTTPPKQTRSPQSLAMSEHLLPTTMSCRDAFDYAWHCHTPGAQWNAVYRYGSVRACSELWDDFWFCMRTKSYSPELKAAAIREHYRLKEEAKYGAGRPSSEDVWASRTERVAPGTAFQKSFEAPVIDDAEFQRMDAERRRRIREMEGLGGNNSGNNSKRG